MGENNGAATGDDSPCFALPSLGACPSNGRDCDGTEMSRMRGGGSSRLSIMSLRDPTTKQTGHFRPTPRGGVLFGPPQRRGSSEYHLCQVRHRRRFLTVAKNHAVATRRLLGQAPGGFLQIGKSVVPLCQRDCFRLNYGHHENCHVENGKF